MAITKRQMQRTERRLLNLEAKIKEVNKDLAAMDISLVGDKTIRPAMRVLAYRIGQIERTGA